jgi:hypothetical protein
LLQRSIAKVIALACLHHSPIAACSEVQRRHALRRRIPVTLRRLSVVAPTSFFANRMAVGNPH